MGICSAAPAGRTCKLLTKATLGLLCLAVPTMAQGKNCEMSRCPPINGDLNYCRVTMGYYCDPNGTLRSSKGVHDAYCDIHCVCKCYQACVPPKCPNPTSDDE